jgi:hypothetical protein
MLPHDRAPLRRYVSLPMAALCLTPAGAAAAPKPASLIPDWKESHFAEADPGVWAAFRLAVCARNHRRAAVEALLATPPESAEEARLLPAAVPPDEADCPMRKKRNVRFTATFMRGALAEALYNGDKDKPKALSLPLADSFDSAGKDEPSNVARWVARCAVRRDPRRAHEVVQFNPGAIGERRALLSLGPVLAACLPAGERLQVTRLRFRALIAQELYQASLSFKESFTHA